MTTNEYKEKRDKLGQLLISAIRDNEVIEAYALVDALMVAQRSYALSEAEEFAPPKKDELENNSRIFNSGYNEGVSDFLSAIRSLF